MLLFQSQFLLFLVLVALVYWPVARWRLASLAVIAFANYFCLARWDLGYLWAIPLASLADFTIAALLEGTADPRLRRALAGLSAVLNIGLILGSKLNALPWPATLSLSFYAFQSLTYTLDVYRRDARASRSPLAHLAATSFFPTLLAGPITRVSTLIAQFEKKEKKLDPADGGRALFLIALGLSKKFLIADYLSENLVNRVFDFPALYTGAETLIAVWAYAIQLYYDFSGYTDIAIGSALLIGIRLPANFNSPYSAIHIADFWRRWHITLSNWLRDYLYFALPGQRTEFWPYANLVITMALGGLWHGLSWNFLIWGLLHGVGLVVVRLLEVRRGKAAPRLPEALRVFCTVQFVCLGWIFFRASTLDNALMILGRITSLTVDFSNVSGAIWMVLVIGIAGHYLPKRRFEQIRDRFAAAPDYAQATALVILTVAVSYVATTGAAPFVYTKF